MTVKELKEKINQFPDNLIVMIPNSNLHKFKDPIWWYVPVISVARGCNESDGFVYIDGGND